MPSFIFTKMIVADLERETAFFEQVIGLKTVMRMVVGEGDAAADEVILSADGKPGGVPSLALLCYRRRPAPHRESWCWDSWSMMRTRWRLPRSVAVGAS